MDTMQINKAVAAVLVSGIAFFVAGRVSNVLVPEHKLEQPAFKIDLPTQAGAPVAAAAAVVPFGNLLASSDPAAGAAAFKSVGCVACHTVNEGGKPGVGPNLYGVLGAKQGGREGFAYSAALSGKGGQWNFEELNKWLTKPAAYAAGTKMAFAGVADDKKRADIISYLNTLQAKPLPLPAADKSAAAPAPAATTTVAAAAPAAPAAAPAPAADEPLPVLLAKADVAAGQKSTMQLGCVACHSFNEGGKNGLGPNLYNVVGQAKAAHEGFAYSAGLKGKGGSWTFEDLNTWLTKPAAFAAGTKMVFAGVPNAQNRANVIAYLRTLSASPVAMP